MTTDPPRLTDAEMLAAVVAVMRRAEEAERTGGQEPGLAARAAAFEVLGLLRADGRL
jgi:uncharacterized protein (DUF362 family)